MEHSDKSKAVKANRLQKLLTVMSAFIGIAALTGTAAAVDWSNISLMIDGIAGIMPAITSLISAIVEPIIVLAVVGFLVGMLNGLLGGLESALRFGR